MKKIYLIISVLVLFVFTSCDFLFAPTGINITNSNSSLEIWYVYITPSVETSWGADMLGSSEVIQPGSERLFRLEPNTYDVLVVFQDGSGGDLYGVTVADKELREINLNDTIIEVTRFAGSSEPVFADRKNADTPAGLKF